MIPGLGRSPGEGNANPLQYSCLGISWTEEPDGLQSMGSQRVGHKFVTKQHQQHGVKTMEGVGFSVSNTLCLGCVFSWVSQAWSSTNSDSLDDCVSGHLYYSSLEMCNPCTCEEAKSFQVTFLHHHKLSPGKKAMFAFLGHT